MSEVYELMREVGLIQKRLSKLQRKLANMATAELDERRQAAHAELSAIREGEAARQAVIADAQSKLVAQARELIETANKKASDDA